MSRCCQTVVLLLAAAVVAALPAPVRSFAADGRPAGKPMTSASTRMKLALIPAGAFEMGSASTEEGHSRNEAPHIVRITRPFLMGMTEVTQDEYEMVVGVNPSSFAGTGNAASKLVGIDTKQFPVENISWFDAVEFCNRLSQMDELKVCYTMGNVEREDGSIKSAVVTPVAADGYRLPTEAEWEYACRAGSTTSYYTGNSTLLLNKAAWYGGKKASAGNSDRQTHLVGQKTANAFGLFDMHGNVSEWCQDWYDYTAYDRSPSSDPPGPTGGSMRVARGGSWDDEAVNCRSAYRGAWSPARRDSNVGFRVVRAAPPQLRPQNRGAIPPFRIVVDRRDGRTLDLFNQETYDTFDAAKQRLAGAKLVGNLGSIRIIDSNGTTIENP